MKRKAFTCFNITFSNRLQVKEFCIRRFFYFSQYSVAFVASDWWKSPATMFSVSVTCTAIPHRLCGCRLCFLSEGRCGRGQLASQSARGVSSVTPFQLTKSQSCAPLVETRGCKKLNHGNYFLLVFAMEKQDCQHNILRYVFTAKNQF